MITAQPTLCHRVVTVGAVTCAAIAAGASATAAPYIWQHSAITYGRVAYACTDGIRLDAAVGADFQRPDDPYVNTAVAAQPPPTTDWDDPDVTLVMSQPISIGRLKDGPVTVDVDGEGLVAMSHLTSSPLTLRYQKPLALGPIAVNLEGGQPGTGRVTAEVTDCSLFAKIDVQPGDRKNRVPVGRGNVTVAVLSTATLDTRATDAATYRFGPKGAASRVKAVRDVDHDGRQDLVLTFRSVDAGLTCATRSVALAGTTPSGGPVEGTAPVQPTRC